MTIDWEKSEKITAGIANPTCRVTRAFARGPTADAWTPVDTANPWMDVTTRPAIASRVPRASASAIRGSIASPWE